MNKIEKTAKVLAGLQAPLSLGVGILGAAEEPYREILSDLPGFGWRDASEFETYLAEPESNDRMSILADYHVRESDDQRLTLLRGVEIIAQWAPAGQPSLAGIVGEAFRDHLTREGH